MQFMNKNMPKQNNAPTRSRHMMKYAFCFSMEHRSSTQHYKKLNGTLVSEINEKQNKRVLFYECI